MKSWHNFLEGLRRAIQEIEEGLLWGMDEQFETGDDAPQTGFNRFWLIAFVVAILAWGLACALAANAGYI